ncbi:tail tape measure protein [Thermaurantiacus sp.]
MRDSFEDVAVAVRADMDGFQRDLAEMRQMLETTLGAGAEAAGRGIESALAKAARSGRLEFEDMARAAARALAEIAAAALKIEFGGAATGRIGGILGGVFGLSGLPGRATGGPVAPGRAYLVGERGPEVFVPTSSGRVEGARGGAPQVINLAVHVSGGSDARRAFMAQTETQVARAVRRALLRLER